jgi:hypothetical protein
MINQFDVFCEIPCLTEQSRQLSGLGLQKKWFKSADKRYLRQYLDKFIDYNLSLFDFLGVHPLASGTDQNASLAFRTSQFVGSIPLRSSDTGKQIGDFVVGPRFTGNNRFQDYIEILDLLGKEISPQTIYSLPLVSGRNFRPPLYLEAVNFVSSLEQLTRVRWRKFDNIEKYEYQPTGQVNWHEYSQRESKVENRLMFPIRKNILSELHEEYGEIRYVFDICKTELTSSNTPIRIRNSLRARLAFLEEKLYRHKPVETNLITVKLSDHPAVRNCKLSANKILSHNFIVSTAWRVDFSDVFEKFVQYVLRLASKETGGRLVSNFAFHSRASHPFSWVLKHVEPDAIYQRDNLLVFIDAKYKSNLYNRFSISEKLKDDHRRDLHQLLAYCSFSKTDQKYGLLIYPSNNLQLEKIKYENGINGVTNTIIVVGLPLKKEFINDAKKLFTKIIGEIEKGWPRPASTLSAAGAEFTFSSGII